MIYMYPLPKHYLHCTLNDLPSKLYQLLSSIYALRTMIYLLSLLFML